MKITRRQLRRLIKEELSRLDEVDSNNDGTLDADELRDIADDLEGMSQQSPLSGQVLTYGQVVKAFNQGQIQFLEITKDAQIASTELTADNRGGPFLVNRSSSLSATYDPTDDPSEMLNPGDRLEIVNTDNEPGFPGGSILVQGGPDNIEFYIFGKDIKSFTRAL